MYLLATSSEVAQEKELLELTQSLMEAVTARDYPRFRYTHTHTHTPTHCLTHTGNSVHRSFSLSVPKVAVNCCKDWNSQNGHSPMVSLTSSHSSHPSHPYYST